jgi:hypothetical protein
VKGHKEDTVSAWIRDAGEYGESEELIELLGKSTAYVERTHLTMRTFSSRLSRKSTAFSKEICIHNGCVRAWHLGAGILNSFLTEQKTGSRAQHGPGKTTNQEPLLIRVVKMT